MEKIDLSFGTLIAYLIPGIVGLFAISPFSTTIELLLYKNASFSMVSGLVIVLLSLATGMVINAIGFLTIRKVFKLIGIKPPTAKEYANLTKEELPVLERITEYTYRYFECYCNLSVAIAILLISNTIIKLEITAEGKWILLTSTLILVLFSLIFLAYYSYNVYSVRMRKLLEDSSLENNTKGGDNMSIGESPK